MNRRVAFYGASGTGKTTLADYVSEKYGLSKNPVGSREVAEAMGFASPYDVDRAGKRGEFQQRLLAEKTAWEASHDSFVTDRTTMDNLAYTMLHAVTAITPEMRAAAIVGLQRYTHVFYCPVSAFINIAGDPARVAERTYHELFDVLVHGLVDRHYDWTRCGAFGVMELDTPALVERVLLVDVHLEDPDVVRARGV